MRRLRLLLLSLSAFAWLASAALGAAAQTDERTVEVVDLSGIWDGRIIDFAADAITSAAESGTVEYVILAIDSRGVVAGPDDLARFAELVADPPLPVVAWVGPIPAVVHGGAAQIVLAADVAVAAPGSVIGHLEPTIAGVPGSEPVVTGPDEIVGDIITVTQVPTDPSDDTLAASISAEIFDEVSAQTAAPRQIGQLLDGREFTIQGETVVLSSVRAFEGGVTNLVTVIREPDTVDQFFRLAATPEAAFFFLVAGLTVAAFEFYAIGPGIAAGTAAVSLVLAGYGLAVLPVRWWAVALSALSVLLMAWSYQRGGIPLFTGLGILGLFVGGFWFTDAAPQIEPGIPGVLLTVASAAFFFLLAMPTVARSRFSTQTIGREGLIGRTGTAVTDLTPAGEVEIDGATWRATSHREAGISAGDPVSVLAVDGWYLDVDVPEESPESGVRSPESEA